MALRRIGTSRDVVAYTFTGDSGWRTPTGKDQPWATSGSQTVTLEPGQFLLEGVPSVVQYTLTPFNNDGGVDLPAVVTYTTQKRLYCSHSGILKITRL